MILECKLIALALSVGYSIYSPDCLWGIIFVLLIKCILHYRVIYLVGGKKS